MNRVASAAVAAGMIAASALTGCSSQSQNPTGPATTTTITVAAAASLTDAMDRLVPSYSASHPATDIKVTTGSSATLAAQLAAGAPIDVLASAGVEVMDRSVADGSVKAPLDFATNSLEIAIPLKNPATLRTWADIARPTVAVARCAVPAPCGTATDELLKRSKLTVKFVSTDPDVRAVLTRVRLSQVDAGIVYRTDVESATNSVKGLAIPGDVNVSTRYQAAVASDSQSAQAADSFVKYLQSPAAQKILRRLGFGPR
ncbi:MAG: molybdate ABC transporter substrate-binding protein [Candidatus Nanopelagicales bacterium]